MLYDFVNMVSNRAFFRLLHPFLMLLASFVVVEHDGRSSKHSWITRQDAI